MEITKTIEEFKELDSKKQLEELNNSIIELNIDDNSLLNEVLSKINEWINKDNLNNDEIIILENIKKELLKDEDPFTRNQNLYVLAMNLKTLEKNQEESSISTDTAGDLTITDTRIKTSKLQEDLAGTETNRKLNIDDLKSQVSKLGDKQIINDILDFLESLKKDSNLETKHKEIIDNIIKAVLFSDISMLDSEIFYRVYKKEDETQITSTSENIDGLIKNINNLGENLLKNDVLTFLKKLKEKDISLAPEYKEILEYIKKAIELGDTSIINTDSFYEKYNSLLKGSSSIPVITPSNGGENLNDEQKNDFKERIKTLKDIKFFGKLESKSWDSLVEDIIKESEFSTEKEKQDFKSYFEKNFKPIYENLKKINTNEINNQLNKALDTLNTLPNNGAIVLPIGSENITFNSKEQALSYIEELKNGLSELESWGIGGTLQYLANGLANGYWELLKFDASVISGTWEAGGFALDNPAAGITLGLIGLAIGGYGYGKLTTFVDQLNSPMLPHDIDKLVQHLKKTIELHKKAGIDTKILEKLEDDISSSIKEGGNSLIENTKLTKRVYRHLQSFRGMYGVDTLNYLLAWGGETADNFFNTPPDPTKPKKVSGWKTLGKVLLHGTHVLPQFLITGFNKGDSGGILGTGWKFKSKKSIIGDYTDAFEKRNQKLKIAYNIIDKAIFDEDKQKIIKNEIIEVHRGNIPISKIDPLSRYYLGGISEIQRKSVFDKLTKELELAGKKDINGNKIEVKSISEFLVNIGKIDNNKISYFKSLIKSFNPIKSVNASIAEILMRNGLGDFDSILSDLDKNDVDFEKSNSNVEKLKKKYLNFIKFYPEINDGVETALKNEINGSSSITEKGLIDKIIEKSGIIGLKKDDIKKFIEMVGDDGGREGIEGNKIGDNIIPKVRAILVDMGDDISKQNEKIQKLTKMLQYGNNTFWEPHLGKIILHLIEGGDYDPKEGCMKYQDVMLFRSDYGVKLSTFLDTYKINLSSGTNGNHTNNNGNGNNQSQNPGDNTNNGQNNNSSSERASNGPRNGPNENYRDLGYKILDDLELELKIQGINFDEKLKILEKFMDNEEIDVNDVNSLKGYTKGILEGKHNNLKIEFITREQWKSQIDNYVSTRPDYVDILGNLKKALERKDTDLSGFINEPKVMEFVDFIKKNFKHGI